MIAMPVLQGLECNDCLESIHMCAMINLNHKNKFDDQRPVSDRLNVVL